MTILTDPEGVKGTKPGGRLWGDKTPSVSVGLAPQVAPARNEQHRLPIPSSGL